MEEEEGRKRHCPTCARAVPDGGDEFQCDSCGAAACSARHLHSHRGGGGDRCLPFRVRVDERRGRHFVATRDIKALDLVLKDRYSEHSEKFIRSFIPILCPNVCQTVVVCRKIKKKIKSEMANTFREIQLVLLLFFKAKKIRLVFPPGRASLDPPPSRTLSAWSASPSSGGRAAPSAPGAPSRCATSPIV